MHRTPILEALDSYQRALSCPEDTVEEFRAFIQRTPLCFHRENLEGHLTASAFVLSLDRQKVLLTLHAKLNKWLQLGGHADGHPYLHEVALREAQEESGAKEFSFIGPLVPFDLDIHWIEERKGVPGHLHYDARYLLVCHDEESIVCSEESLDLRWVPLKEIKAYTQEVSTIRQAFKAQKLIS